MPLCGGPEFALANGAPELLPPGVLGRSVLLSIADLTTKQIYRLLFGRVAEAGRRIGFGIRCDSPTLKRFLRLEIELCSAGFALTSTILKVVRRPPQHLLVVGRQADDEFVRICSWCKRVDVGGDWLEVEVATERLELFNRERLPQLTHGVCERCYEEINRLIEDPETGPPAMEPA